MTRNEFNLLYTIKKNGLQSFRKMKETAGVSMGYITKTMRAFRENGYVDDNGITDRGLEALRPYKVDNAIIMAAGMGVHFVPLTLEKPTGLLTVRNEVLIEREIEQLQEAGIREIILVLGYKKEAFFYLEKKYPNLRFIINGEYNMKHNTHTLYLARQHFGNSYICSSDNYYEENPFEEYVYRAYYSGVPVSQKTEEWYMIPDVRGCIAQIESAGDAGIIMLGHAYWDNGFSQAMRSLLEQDHGVGKYDQSIWELVLKENLKALPPMEVKVYGEHTIFEFDSLEELREFDQNYVNQTHAKSVRNIARCLNCAESEVQNYEAIKKGLTNSSFIFEVRGKKYVYRHPGEGTEVLISRPHEKKALELAKAIGIDPTYLYMDDIQGWKISTYVENVRQPDYGSEEDSQRVIEVLKKLHQRNISVPWSFLPWEEACKIEVILRSEKGGIADRDFEKLKEHVEKCYRRCDGDGITMRFCHCDTYAPNWMLTENRTILIDWEYAGNADPGCDVGSYIMDAMWDIPKATEFIRSYCGEDAPDSQIFHYLAYTAIVSYYWYVWALYREACGAVMGESLYNWNKMAWRYSEYLVERYHL